MKKKKIKFKVVVQLGMTQKGFELDTDFVLEHSGAGFYIFTSKRSSTIYRFPINCTVIKEQ